MVACKKHGVPIISRISDYQIMCPKCTFYRDGNICEKCKKTKLYSLRYRCIKKSFISSFLWFLADAYHRYMKYYDLIDAFVLTNPFMMNKLQEYGYDKKYKIIRTCSDDNSRYKKAFTHKNKLQQLCYIGNVFEHKGVDLLLKSFSILIKKRPNIKLIIMGNDVENIIQNSIDSENIVFENIKYIKHSNIQKVFEVLSESLYFVMPVKWYDNLPNAIIESFSVGTPVISSNIGSIRYMIENGKSGYLFESGDVESLTNVIYEALSISEGEYEKMQENCINEIKIKYDKNVHYNKLYGIMKKVSQ